MKRIINILLVSLILFHISCKEEFLEPKPKSFYAPENVYVDKAGFESGLVTVRKDMMNEFYGNRSHMQADFNFTDQGCMAFAGDWSKIGPSSGTYLPIIPMFTRFYGYIKNTNVIISRIDDIEWENQQDRNEILAQALFYRSWWYYRLVHTYGDVPFVGHELKAAKLDFYSHSTWTILDKIQTDMEFAVQWLPENPTPNKGRPSKYAGLHLLAKIYIANTEFDKAIEAATNVINGPFDLMQNRFGAWKNDSWRNVLWDLHRPENKAITENTEAIFIFIDRHEAPEGAKSAGTYTQRGFTCTWWHSFVKDSEGKHGTRSRYPDLSPTAQYDTLGLGNPDITSTPWFSYTLWAEGGYDCFTTPDLRRADCNWIDTHPSQGEILYNEETSVDYGKPIDPNNFARLSDTLICLWPFAWYKLWYPYEEGWKGPNIMGSNGDYYIFRLAETYLIRAEAYFWKGQNDLAAADINIVRQRSHAVPISAGDIDLDYIFDERSRELHHEEFRHTELVRASKILAKLNKNGYSLDEFSENNWYYDRVMSHNKFFQVGDMEYGKFIINPHHVLWPIDIKVITANTLGVINQNEGYEGSESNVPPLEVIEEEEGEE